MPTTLNEQQSELLETLAFNEATGKAARGTQHGSRLARIAVGGWQAVIIGRSKDVTIAGDPAEFRRAMENRDVAVVFLPHSAMITGQIIESTCCASPFDKLIVWETDK